MAHRSPGGSAQVPTGSVGVQPHPPRAVTRSGAGSARGVEATSSGSGVDGAALGGRADGAGGLGAGSGSRVDLGDDLGERVDQAIRNAERQAASEEMMGASRAYFARVDRDRALMYWSTFRLLERGKCTDGIHEKLATVDELDQLRSPHRVVSSTPQSRPADRRWRVRQPPREFRPLRRIVRTVENLNFNSFLVLLSSPLLERLSIQRTPGPPQVDLSLRGVPGEAIAEA
jgi:hypothetical protein